MEVSDEIVEAFLLDKRAEAARDRKMFRYKDVYKRQKSLSMNAPEKAVRTPRRKLKSTSIF